MACFSCSKKSTPVAPKTVSTCNTTRDQIVELGIKIKCLKETKPSAKMEGAFSALLDMLQTDNFCKYDLAIIHQLIQENPDVC